MAIHSALASSAILAPDPRAAYHNYFDAQRSLVKAGWRARRPSGLSSDHTYVKPGVKGKLRQDKVDIDYFIDQEATVETTNPAATEEEATVATANMTATEEAMVATANMVATEQGVTVGTPIMAATEQGANNAVDTSQIAIEDTNAGGGAASFEEELKPDDEPGLEACARDDDEPGLAEFDRDDFMEVFRAENLFGPVDVDDVNIGDESFLCSAESDDEDSAEVNSKTRDFARNCAVGGAYIRTACRSIGLSVKKVPFPGEPLEELKFILVLNQEEERRRIPKADSFYSSPALALSLLPLGFYYVGTQRSDRPGWPKELMFKQKKKPQSMPRGTYRIAQARQYPELVAAAWMDSSPAHMIATG
ncbi:uncharacterized protein PITG_15207 [Phytophthora infestans T30-4]|uniref:PiggyBac transposable element-derived protein domain-containing protein n=1 Tax=Phytophthora infestans (strain T30-4) TaxID=403677 RepID=D0NQ60_PHYIT|nr:uncharacterized protein PITG_15207 [Phytophthora infestans T30-4]EEY62792.1 conserved hypothetical protein [Phytophthora infestans T30-4]|eukprot:XP_002898667.1 conserved hypothetical protein [Phytophthora infestans T30-4]